MNFQTAKWNDLEARGERNGGFYGSRYQGRFSIGPARWHVNKSSQSPRVRERSKRRFATGQTTDRHSILYGKPSYHPTFFFFLLGTDLRLGAPQSLRARHVGFDRARTKRYTRSSQYRLLEAETRPDLAFLIRVNEPLPHRSGTGSRSLPIVRVVGGYQC